MGYNEGAKQGPTIRGGADKVTLEGLLKRGRFLRVNIFFTERAIGLSKNGQGRMR